MEARRLGEKATAAWKRVRETQSFSFSSFIAEEKMICKSDDIFNGFRGFSCREKEEKLYLRRRSVFSPLSFLSDSKLKISRHH